MTWEINNHIHWRETRSLPATLCRRKGCGSYFVLNSIALHVLTNHLRNEKIVVIIINYIVRVPQIRYLPVRRFDWAEQLVYT